MAELGWTEPVVSGYDQISAVDVPVSPVFIFTITV
jgi:hypothetical protein